MLPQDGTISTYSAGTMKARMRAAPALSSSGWPCSRSDRVQREVRGHRRAAGVVPAAADAVAVAIDVGVAGRRAAAGDTHAPRADDLARPRAGGRKPANQPAPAHSVTTQPMLPSIDAICFFQPDDGRQRQLGAAGRARRQHPQPAAAVDQRLLHRMQEAAGIRRQRGFADAPDIPFGQRVAACVVEESLRHQIILSVQDVRQHSRAQLPCEAGTLPAAAMHRGGPARPR